MKGIRITSESVSEGHPDKICDQISDGILDEYIKLDRNSHVAIESMISNNLLVIAGEVRSSADVNIEKISREIICSIGYDSQKKGFDGNNCIIITNVNKQSEDISSGVDIALEYKNQTHEQSIEVIGAGDQGIMYGYACDETSDFLPIPIYYAHQLVKKLAEVRKSSELPYLYPDGKAQVTVQYDDAGNPTAITDILISAQHHEQITQEQLKRDTYDKVLKQVIPESLLQSFNPAILVNPTGRFVIGGPNGDTGLTGRKIIVDTYGGVVPHGGGAFSGKDPSKVDRTGAYMARYVAKNIVAAKIAKKCQISVAYAIGVAEPIAITVNTYGTGIIPDSILSTIVESAFDFTPGGIIKNMDLLRPIYKKTATYGHFKSDSNLPWEKTDKVALLTSVLSNL